MKKFVTLTLALICLFALSTSAYAYNWNVTEVEVCEKYTIEITKYEAVLSGDTIAYKANDAVIAKKGDYVYFSFVVTNSKGEEVLMTEENFQITGLKSMEIMNAEKGIYKAVATTNAPCFKITITEKSAFEELAPKVQFIPTGEDNEGIVIIGELAFTTNARGIVQEAYKPALSTIIGALNEETIVGSVVAEDADLAKLGITRAQIKADKVLMTEDVLIANFGKVCKSEKQVCWGYSYAFDEDDVLGIPKTGDASVLMASATMVLTACAIWKKKED